MGKHFKRTIATILVVLLCFTIAPLQTDSTIKANAADSVTTHNTAIDAYINFFKANAFKDEAFFYCGDINGDEIPELITDCHFNGEINIYSFNASSKSIYQIFTSRKGKGYAMYIYLNPELNKVLIPSADTGGATHRLYAFSGDGYTLIKKMHYLNTKHSNSGLPEYYLNDVLTTESVYDTELKNAQNSCPVIVNYPISSYHSILASLKKSAANPHDTAIDAYISFIASAGINTDSFFDCADINGDQVPELILDRRMSGIEIYSYNTSSKKVYELYSALKGKGYAMDVYISPELNKVLLPAADTGGESYTLCTFSGNKCTINKTFEITNDKHSPSGKGEIRVNNILTSKATYDAALAAAKKDCHLIVKHSISSYRTLLTAMKSTELGRTSKIISTQSTDAIKLVWAQVKGAAGYAVYQKIGEKWTRLGNRTVNNATISNLKAGTSYEFAIRAAEKINGKVIWSNTFTIIKTRTLAAKPKNVTSAQNANTIKLTWDSSYGARGYRIYYKSGNSWKVAVNATAATSHTFTGLKPGSKFTFAIRPYSLTNNGVVWSAYTEFETATTPAATTNITANATTNSVTLNWNKVAGATHYRVYQKTSSGWTSLGFTTALTGKVNNLKPGTTYTFAVRSYVNTSSSPIAGAYKEIKVTTINANDNCVAITDGGIKLYPITSNEAKEIYNKWGTDIRTYYEAKASNGKTLIYSKGYSGWGGVDIDGAFYHDNGEIEVCDYCGKINGLSSNHCDGSCNFILQ